MLLYPATVIAAFFLLWLRRPEALTEPRLFAEDGAVYYASYLVDGPVRSIFEPINGFLCVIPRLIATAVGFSSAAQIPVLFGAISLAGVALSCGFFALPEFRYFLRNDQARVACCLAFAAIPYTYGGGSNLAMLPWYACIPTMLLLALPRRGFNGRPFWYMLASALIVLLTALSAPGLFVFVPLACYKIYKGTSRVRIVATAFLIGMVVQLMVFRVSGHVDFGTLSFPSVAASLSPISAYRVLLHNLIGRLTPPGLSAGYTIALSVLTNVVVLVAIIAYIRTQKKAAIARRLTYIASATIASIVIAAVAGQIEGDPTLGADFAPLQMEHYLLIPIALFFFMLAYACDDLLRRWTTQPFRALAFVACVTIAAIVNFRLPALANDDWASHAPLTDSWRAARTDGVTHSALDLAVDPAGWTVSLPALQGVR